MSANIQSQSRHAEAVPAAVVEGIHKVAVMDAKPAELPDANDEAHLDNLKESRAVGDLTDSEDEGDQGDHEGEAHPQVETHLVDEIRHQHDASQDGTGHHSYDDAAVVQDTNEVAITDAKPAHVAVATVEAHLHNSNESRVEGQGDVDMTDIEEYEDDVSEYEDHEESDEDGSMDDEEVETPTGVSKANNANMETSPVKKTSVGAVGNNITSGSPVGDNARNQQTKTPVSRVLSGRVKKSGPAASGADLKCPVKGCGQIFPGKNPRQGLWHHLKYFGSCNLPERAAFAQAHGEAHEKMKRETGKSYSNTPPSNSHRVSDSDTLSNSACWNPCREEPPLFGQLQEQEPRESEDLCPYFEPPCSRSQKQHYRP
jgi:hypothetical protein